MHFYNLVNVEYLTREGIVLLFYTKLMLLRKDSVCKKLQTLNKKIILSFILRFFFLKRIRSGFLPLLAHSLQDAPNLFLHIMCSYVSYYSILGTIICIISPLASFSGFSGIVSTIPCALYAAETARQSASIISYGMQRRTFALSGIP